MQGSLSSPARDSSSRFKQALDIAGTDHMNTARMNTRQIISATLRYGGEGDATLQLVTIGIGKVARLKISQLGQLPTIGECWCGSALVGRCKLGVALCLVSVV